MIKTTADGSNTLFSSAYNQTFHSDKGAVTESKHVFLDASGVTERLHLRQDTSVLEVGFGTGLNFFLTADLAIKSEANLNYVALEKDLLEAEVIQSLGFERYLQDSELIEKYLRFRRALMQTSNQAIFEYKNVVLTLGLGEATSQHFAKETFDAIYQDAFSPDANPELWTGELFSNLFVALKPNGRLTTYSVKGDVRRALQSVGFKVKKHPGPPGGKREMLVASRVENECCE